MSKVHLERNPRSPKSAGNPDVCFDIPIVTPTDIRNGLLVDACSESAAYEHSGEYSLAYAVGPSGAFTQTWDGMRHEMRIGIWNHFCCKEVKSNMHPDGDQVNYLRKGYRGLFVDLQQKLGLYWLLRTNRDAIAGDGCPSLPDADWDGVLRNILGAMCAVALDWEVVRLFSDGFCRDWNDASMGIDPTPEEYLSMRGWMRGLKLGWQTGDCSWMNDADHKGPSDMEEYYDMLQTGLLHHRHIGILDKSSDATTVTVRVPYRPDSGVVEDNGYAERRSVLDWSAAGGIDGCTGPSMMLSRCPTRSMMCMIMGLAGFELFRNAGPHPEPLVEPEDDAEEIAEECALWGKLSPFLFPDNVGIDWVVADSDDSRFSSVPRYDQEMDDPAWKRMRAELDGADIPSGVKRLKGECGVARRG